MVFENLIWRESLLIDGQVDDEGGSFAFLAVASDCSFVESYQILGQCKSQAGSDDFMLAILSVLEAPEQIFHFLLRDAVTSIAYIYNKVVEVFVGFCFYGHFPTFSGIFGGI